MATTTPNKLDQVVGHNPLAICWLENRTTKGKWDGCPSFRNIVSLHTPQATVACNFALLQTVLKLYILYTVD